MAIFAARPNGIYVKVLKHGQSLIEPPKWRAIPTCRSREKFTVEFASQKVTCQVLLGAPE